MARLFIFFVIILCTPNLSASPKASANLQHVIGFKVNRNEISDRELFKQKEEILGRIVSTFNYLNSEAAEQLYSEHFDDSVSIETVKQSLFRFYLILRLSPDFDTFISRVRKNFAVYKSVGHDGRGTVKFTGYFQPVYKASLTKTDQFKYPIFKKPIDFETWPEPHPTRVKLEGYKGLGEDGTLLKGQELAWLSSRYDVFMIHLQGSAILQLSDGKNLAVGFDAGTKHPFRGISGEYLRKHNIAWHRLGEFFNKNPNELDSILSRNNRFIFFKANPTPDAIGSLGVPVLAERSIATDNLKLPPGAVGLISTKIPTKTESGTIELKESTRFVLNLDTGSAIKGPGRVDVYMGTGEEAKIKASSLFNSGELYYLFKKM